MSLSESAFLSELLAFLCWLLISCALLISSLPMHFLSVFTLVYPTTMMCTPWLFSLIVVKSCWRSLSMSFCFLP